MFEASTGLEDSAHNEHILAKGLRPVVIGTPVHAEQPSRKVLKTIRVTRISYMAFICHRSTCFSIPSLC